MIEGYEDYPVIPILHKYAGCWRVSDGLTGLYIDWGETKAEVLERFRDHINSLTIEDIEDRISEATREHKLEDFEMTTREGLLLKTLNKILKLQVEDLNNFDRLEVLKEDIINLAFE